MKAAIKQSGLAALSAPPIYAGLRWHAHRENPVTVLCYHTLRPDDQVLDAWIALRVKDFQQQVAALRKTYDIVSLDQAMEAAEPATRPRVVLTFDDGERGLIDHLLPFVEAEKIPVTVYVATGQIETGHPYWFDRVMNALQGSGVTEIDMRAKGLSLWHVGPMHGKMRWSQIGEILEALKNAKAKERDHLADEIIAQIPATEPQFTPLAPMTIPQIQELASNPFVTIGAHTHCHSLLDQIPLIDALDSIARSRKLLEEWTGQPVRHFAYPNGNYTPELMAGIADLGFTSASIVDMGLAGPDAHPFALPRIGVGRYDSLQRFLLRLVGI